eukprot:TRINITY_DN24151_c0_g1_i1.p1 TRINITY_DN24151_c0_g1~~TRINITY_DN24151_c0_g1_i1.p1  ORF type:complete len:667 (-),score=81.28 TRINITY_DN24151_c0_g1_i1:154-2154(-)
MLNHSDQLRMSLNSKIQLQTGPFSANLSPSKPVQLVNRNCGTLLVVQKHDCAKDQLLSKRNVTETHFTSLMLIQGRASHCLRKVALADVDGKLTRVSRSDHSASCTFSALQGPGVHVAKGRELFNQPLNQIVAAFRSVEQTGHTSRLGIRSRRHIRATLESQNIDETDGAKENTTPNVTDAPDSENKEAMKERQVQATSSSVPKALSSLDSYFEKLKPSKVSPPSAPSPPASPSEASSSSAAQPSSPSPPPPSSSTGRAVEDSSQTKSGDDWTAGEPRLKTPTSGRDENNGQQGKDGEEDKYWEVLRLLMEIYNAREDASEPLKDGDKGDGDKGDSPGGQGIGTFGPTFIGDQVLVNTRLVEKEMRERVFGDWLQSVRLGASLPMVNSLVVINILFFLISKFGPSLLPNNLMATLPSLYLAKVNSYIAAGDWWRLFTPTLLHAGFFHLLFGTIALIEIGTSVEITFGSLNFLGAYVIGGAFGNLLSYETTPEMTVGGTGAVYSLIAAWSAYLWRNRATIGEKWVANEMRNVLFLAGLNLAIGNPLPIDDATHIGGALGGLLYALLLSPTIDIRFDSIKPVTGNSSIERGLDLAKGEGNETTITEKTLKDGQGSDSSQNSPTFLGGFDVVVGQGTIGAIIGTPMLCLAVLLAAYYVGAEPLSSHLLP